MTSTADGVRVVQWKLRRLAPRALEVLQRHRDWTTLQHFEDTLPPAVARFVGRYDASRALAASGAPASERAAVRELERCVQAWLGPLERDIAGLETSAFMDHSASPDDLVVYAEQLLAVVRAYAAVGSPALPYAANLERDLTAAIADARLCCEQRQARLAREQEALAEARAAAQAVHRELLAFRRSLRAVLGMHHRDYQQMRMHRQLRSDDEAVESDAQQALTRRPQAAPPQVALGITEGKSAPVADAGGDAAKRNGRNCVARAPAHARAV